MERLPAVKRGAPWSDVSEDQWNDWRWQQANRLCSAEAVNKVIGLTVDEQRAAALTRDTFPLAITPYYASLVNPADPTDPVRLQAVPQLGELSVQQDDLVDPLAEDSHMPVEGLTHRYPDRALLYATHHCAVYCRHCNRKRKVGDPTSAVSRADILAWVEYLKAHPEIRDVLLSGGDPLTFSDTRLGEILGQLRTVQSLDIIRLATRNPVTLPQRVTPQLCEILKAHHPIYVSVHFNHLNECTPQAERALTLLADAGCVISNQMVLLKGVNEDPEMVREMNRWLLARRCRPYYIFQCDSTAGVAHFKTPIASGLRIIDNLRGRTSGLAIPHYVVDLPGGGGKITMQPDYVQRRDDKTWTLRNGQGELYEYVEGE